MEGFSDPNYGNWGYTDAALLSNYLKNAADDINQTNESVIRDKTAKEMNPLVVPFTEHGSGLYNAGGMIGAMLLSNRWTNMENEKQRKAEMGLAGLIEAAALAYSKEPWQLSYGWNF